jgi:hypothetical protein
MVDLTHILHRLTTRERTMAWTTLVD